MRFRVGLDVDGVGHTFSAGVREHMDHTGLGYIWKSGPTPEPYWNWYKDWGWSDQEFEAFCDAAADDGCLFTGYVREGYKECIDDIRTMGDTIVIVTDRAFGSTPEVSEELTRKWFEEEDIYYDELIFSGDKTVGNCDFFVEDKIANYDALRRAGANAFLLNRAWNQEQDNRQRIDDLSEYTRSIFDAHMQLAFHIEV